MFSMGLVHIGRNLASALMPSSVKFDSTSSVPHRAVYCSVSALSVSVRIRQSPSSVSARKFQPDGQHDPCIRATDPTVWHVEGTRGDKPDIFWSPPPPPPPKSFFFFFSTGPYFVDTVVPSISGSKSRLQTPSRLKTSPAARVRAGADLSISSQKHECRSAPQTRLPARYGFVIQQLARPLADQILVTFGHERRSRTCDRHGFAKQAPMSYPHATAGFGPGISMVGNGLEVSGDFKLDHRVVQAAPRFQPFCGHVRVPSPGSFPAIASTTRSSALLWR